MTLATFETFTPFRAGVDRAARAILSTQPETTT
jgi:hypothetical protein